MHSWYDMIQKVKRWVDENIEGKLSLSEIAGRLGYSYFYTTKKFHEIEGVSFREYLSRRKIQNAAVDLYTTTERMVDVAVKYGYSSQESFTRAFIKVFGVTPAVYRRMQKPTSTSEKRIPFGIKGLTEPIVMKGRKDMKLYVKQMFDWNCYAYYAEDVDEQYRDFFQSCLWWPVDRSFIKPYDNVADFEYCADNFTKYGEIAIKQQLKILPSPWEKALDLFIPEMQKTGVDWYVHGSAAMALWGIDVKPKDVNVIIPNYSDFDKVREHFYKMAIKPIERCENWVMSGLGEIFMEAVIEIAFHNRELEPYDMTKLDRIDRKGTSIYVSNLEMLKQDNEYFNRPERVRLIEAQMGSR